MARVWLASVLIGTLFGEASAVAAPPFHPIGVARVDITPEYPVRLSAFGFRREESEGITQRIWAKALAIGDEQPFVLITVDNLGIPDAMVREVAARLGNNTNVRRERLAVTATHTHTAPMLRGVAPTLFGEPIPPEHQERIDRYTRELADNLEEVARAALLDRRRAWLSWGIGKVGFAKNRRTAGGPVDHDLPVLVVRAPAGEIRAIYVSYACHCVTLSHNKISGDWAGYAQEMIERNHPGAVALVSVGCGADSNPNSGVTGDRVEVAEAQGVEIANEVNRLAGGNLKPITGELEAHYRRITLPFDEHPTREEWEERAKRQDAIGYHARVQLERLDRGEPLQTELDYPIQSWAFGDDLAMVFLPGEVVADYSLRLKKELDRDRLWINAYANDAPCYIPSERVLKQGGYEGIGAMVYYDRPTRLKPGIEDKTINAVHEQIGERFAARDRTERGEKDGAAAAPHAAPLSPEDSLAAMRTKPDLRVELVAAEPLVTDPVAIDFGPDGRLWVAEMHDYPEGRNGNHQPGGRIRVLEDADDDGQYDTGTVFLDGIPFPTGVTVWRKGVLVCAAPDILYAEDTDGDGKADVRRVLFTGFATHNYQARVNSLEYGLDGWVYGSGGLFGGKICSFASEQEYALENRDFRMRPDTGEIEPASGRTQQGRVRDDWGNWFGCTNGSLLLHYPLADHRLRRNPHFTPPSTIVSPLAGSSRLYSITEQAQRFELSGPPNHVTAACGLGIYRDELLGEEYAGGAFTCEPVNLVVHRRVVKSTGVLFSAERAEDEADSEFLASTDPWFRPVQVRTGPDGGLWIVDMYRFIIEHPRWIPPKILAELDARAGDDRGRIYRILPRDQPPRPIARLDGMSTQELVAALQTPNGPQRDLAMQILVWQQDEAAVPLLADLVAPGSRPQARLQALCTLNGLASLRPEVVLTALKDEHLAVRRHAVRLSAAFLDVDSRIAGAIRDLVENSHESPEVAMELAYSLGEWDHADAGDLLGRLARRHHRDAYLQAAVLSSMNGGNVLAALHHILSPSAEMSASVPERFTAAALPLVGDERRRELLKLLFPESGLEQQPWRKAALIGLLEAAGQRKLDLERLSAGEAHYKSHILSGIEHARASFQDRAQSDGERVFAARMLGHLRETRDADLAALAGELGPQNSVALQEAALAVMRRINDERVPDELFARWERLTPALRSRAIELLLNRRTWAAALLERIEAGSITTRRIDATRRQQIVERLPRELRERAERVLASGANTDRAEVLAQHRDVLGITGDAARGREVFGKSCAACHRLDGAGHEVGPDLAALTSRSPEVLLEAILDPNRAIDERYLSYTAVTTDGRVYSGILADETTVDVSLRTQENRVETLARRDIEEFRSTGKSLMPQGVEKDLSKQDLADLLAYLAGAAGGN